MEAVGYVISATTRSGQTYVSQKKFVDISNTEAYSEAVAQNVVDSGLLMMKSGQDTEGYIFLRVAELTSFRIRFLLEDRDIDEPT
jgi:hypothetical protein